MAYDICMAKLITGEMVIGKRDAEAKTINDPAILQTIPSQQGVQMLLMPYGYPFEQEFSGSLSESHVIYCPTLGGLKPTASAGSFSISCLKLSP
jgi:hypothetical protein